MKQLLQFAHQFYPYFILTWAFICLGILLRLKANRDARNQAERDEYDKQFDHLDRAAKPNQRGL